MRDTLQVKGYRTLEAGTGEEGIGSPGRDRALSQTSMPVSRLMSDTGPPTRIIEVDPRHREPEVRGIAERPRRIADGVLSAVRACGFNNQ